MKRVHKSVDEMIAQSNQAAGGAGLRCPKCHCVQFAQKGKQLVRNTVLGDDEITRYRVCRNPACGYTWTTVEA